jgi:hypothetical protein
MRAFLTTLLLLTLLPQSGPPPRPFSTCPEEMYKRNTGYVLADPAELVKYAEVKVWPALPESCRCEGSVRVQIFVERDRVFCANALDGPPQLQDAAVKAAMQWRFKKKRPAFKEDIYGVLTFGFKK